MKLFSSRSVERTGTQNTLDVFNGIRTMSIGWVVVGHSVLINVTQSFVYNYREINNYFKKEEGALIYGAEYGVDVFFWMSGFLMTYLFISQIARNNGLTPF